MGDLYGTGIEVWAGFGTIGSTEKRVRADYEQLLRVVFSCFQGKNGSFKKKHCSVRTKKLQKMKLRIFFLKKILKKGFFIG